METGSIDERDYLRNVGRVAHATERIADALEQIAEAALVATAHYVGSQRDAEDPEH